MKRIIIALLIILISAQTIVCNSKNLRMNKKQESIENKASTKNDSSAVKSEDEDGISCLPIERKDVLFIQLAYSSQAEKDIIRREAKEDEINDIIGFLNNETKYSVKKDKVQYSNGIPEMCCVVIYKKENMDIIHIS